MDFLLLLHVGVILRHAEQRQLLHEIDLVGLAHVLLHEGRDRQGEGRGIEHDLQGHVQEWDEDRPPGDPPGGN